LPNCVSKPNCDARSRCTYHPCKPNCAVHARTLLPNLLLARAAADFKAARLAKAAAEAQAAAQAGAQAQ